MEVSMKKLVLGMLLAALAALLVVGGAYAQEDDDDDGGDVTPMTTPGDDDDGLGGDDDGLGDDDDGLGDDGTGAGATPTTDDSATPPGSIADTGYGPNSGSGSALLSWLLASLAAVGVAGIAGGLLLRRT
jgi:hypothetical protein